MGFVNIKTGKQIKLSTGYLSNPIDYQTFVKRQEEKRRSASASPAAVSKTETTATKGNAAAAPGYRAEGLPSKAKRDAAAAPRIRAEGLPSARPSAVSLQKPAPAGSGGPGHGRRYAAEPAAEGGAGTAGKADAW